MNLRAETLLLAGLEPLFERPHRPEASRCGDNKPSLPAAEGLAAGLVNLLIVWGVESAFDRATLRTRNRT